MKYDDRFVLESALEDVSPGQLSIVRNLPVPEASSPIRPLCIQITGKGRMEEYQVFPGVTASYTAFLASDVTVHHTASPAVMELFYCRSGRVGWNMQGNTAIYLGAGDMTVHSTVCCAHSAMMFPTGYAEGLSLAIDLEKLAAHCPDILQQAGLDFHRIQQRFCGSSPVALSACEELAAIFAPLYQTDSSLRLPYLRLKVQELLLFLSGYSSAEKGMAQYFSQQTELIKEIHAMLVEHLDRRFTIEELSRQYAINTSTLKAVFKTVYGLPIATYMKEYRIRKAMKLLRETDYSIAQIAARVGYESQGKFANAFKDVVRLLPTEYRKAARAKASAFHHPPEGIQ